MGRDGIQVSIVRAMPIAPFLSFGLILAWSQFANNAYGAIDSLAAFGGVYRFANMASTLANAATLLLAGCFSRRAASLVLSPRFSLGCGIVASAASLGALLLSLAGAPDMQLAMLLCALFAVAGSATGLLFVAVGSLYGRLIGRQAVFNLAWSHMLCGALFFVAVGMAHWHLGRAGDMLLPSAFYVLLPVAAGGLCAAALSVDPPESGFYSADVRDIPAVFWKLVVVILVLCFAMSFTGAVSQGSLGTEGPLLRTRSNNFFRVVIALVLMMSVVFAKRGVFELGRVYTAIMVSSVAVVTMAPVMDGEVAGWSQLSSAVLLVFRMLHWVVLCLIVYQKQLSPVLVFGLGAGVQALGNGLGLLFGFVAGDGLHEPSAQLLTSIVLTLLIILCAFVLFSEKSFDDLFAQRNEGDLDLAQLFAPLPAFAMGAEQRSAAGSCGVAEVDVCRRAALDEESGLAVRTHPSSQVERLGGVLVADACADGGEAPGAFGQAIERLAAESGLSKREAEVFRLIAMGYNPQTISAKLCISWNTVRGHARNIYAKLGVHSHQELIVLVDSQKEALRKA